MHKDQLALAVRKNFNANGVNETDVLVDLLYKVKHQGTDNSSRNVNTSLTRLQTGSFGCDSRRGNSLSVERDHRATGTTYGTLCIDTPWYGARSHN